MQSLFSEHWHIVRSLKPKLRDGVQSFPRKLRNRSWILLHDPTTQKFVRVTPQSWRVIKLMNGKRTLDDIWETACVEHSEQKNAFSEQAFQSSSDLNVIGQQDLVQMMGQLYSNDLIQTQVSPDATEMFQRYKKQKFQKFKQSFLNPISIKIPLFYPDTWFTKQTGLAQRLYTWPFLIGWCVFVLPAFVLSWQHWSALTNNLSDRVLSTSNLAILWLTYPIVKALHEWCHGLAVKAWGGAVREIGLMLIIFMPIPYVDASSSYRFTSKWVRALVAATGVMAELFLGALAIYVWLLSEPGLIRAFAFNVILIAGVSTILINGNPLMRYDGYYLLTDVVEIPNLSQRAKKYWVYLSDKYLMGATEAHPPIGSDRETRWLFWYGMIAPIYRIVIIGTLIWFVAQKYFFLGVVIAILSAWMSLVMPMWKGIKHVNTGNTLFKYRDKAKRRFHAMVLAVVAVLTLIPVPFYSVQQGVVWLPDESIVRAQSTGHVTDVFVTQDQQLKPNTILMQLNNDELTSQLALETSKQEEVKLQLRQARLDSQSEVNELEMKLNAATAKVAKLQADVDALTVMNTTTGSWQPRDFSQPIGQFIKKGDVVGHVIAGESDRLRVAVVQDDMKLIQKRIQGIQVRPSQQMRQRWSAEIVRITPQGDHKLVSEALSASAGGSIHTNPSQAEGVQAIERIFDIELNVLDKPKQASVTDNRFVFGDRVYVRFDLGWSPLAWQWMIRLKQLFLKHFYV